MQMAAFFCPVLKIILEMNDITPFIILFHDHNAHRCAMYVQSFSNQTPPLEWRGVRLENPVQFFLTKNKITWNSQDGLQQTLEPA